MALKQAFAQNAILRKERSEKFLNKQNIKINPHLPVIEDENEAKLKSPEQTVKRAVTALFATQIAMDVLNPQADVKESATFFGEMLARLGLSDEPTPEEKMFFALVNDNAPKPAEKFASDMAWRIEMVVPLLWACGIISEDLAYPDKVSEYIEAARMIASCDNFDELMMKVNMRNPSKILDKADLLFRMDWACVDARLKGEVPSGNLNSDVVVEQHKGINWLIGAFDAEEWDKVKPHT
ncbi:MAG: DUF4272 domain-containing protein [Oscillospiraceae bacterium]|nr:DUF4272 domain-containing protein [Oscillospiraceae bacterium]